MTGKHTKVEKMTSDIRASKAAGETTSITSS